MPVRVLRGHRSSPDESTKQKRTQRYSFHDVTPDFSSPLVAIPVLFAGGVLLWGWASVVAAHLLSEEVTTQPPEPQPHTP